MKLTLMIDAGVPRSGSMEKPEEKPCPVEQQVKDLICMVESHKESPVEWKTLKRFYSQLTEMKQSTRVTNLRDMIRPILSKYGFHVQ